jgi:hypothetical protein
VRETPMVVALGEIRSFIDTQVNLCNSFLALFLKIFSPKDLQG